MHQTRTGLIAFGIAVLLMLTACGGGGGAGSAGPTANAGAAQTVYAGTTVTLNGSASSSTNGNIASYAWTQTAGTPVVLSDAGSAQPSFVAPLGAPVATLVFSLVITDTRHATSAAATVTITVNSTVAVTGIVRFARVPFSSVSPFGLNYAAPVMMPARAVTVRALDAASQAVLATSTTDASGAYSMTVAPSTSIVIQVVAQMQRDSTQPPPRWDVRVQDGLTGNTPYTFNGAAFNSNAAAQNIDIPLGIAANGSATGVRASGPFAILDTIYTAMQTIIGVAPGTTFPSLVVDWGSQKVGTQFSVTPGGVQYIQLLADLTEDTDEFDQHLVAHEFGHYIQQNFSRDDSIGGSHGAGDKLDTRVAFSEGFGTAFSAMVLNDPVMRDSFVFNGALLSASYNVETNPPVSGDPACWCSEASTISILWDLYDAATDGVDNVALGFGPIWDVLVNAQRTTPAMTSMFSFIAALNAARPADANAINTLVSVQGFTTSSTAGLGVEAFAKNETNEPMPGINKALPLYPTIVVGTPVVVRSVNDSGHYNKLGNSRFLQFKPVTSGNVTVSVTTSNTAPTRDPDFLVFSSGALIKAGIDSSAQYPETETFAVTAGTTYVIEAYDCANGCSSDQGTPGDYDVTVTVN